MIVVSGCNEQCIDGRWKSYLHQKRIGQEWIIVHLNPGNVADYLEDLAAAYGDKERPCAGMNAEEQLDDEDEGEDEEVEGVTDEGGVIMHLGPR